MRRVLLVLAAVAAVVVAEIVWLAPATLVGRRIEEASAGALRLTGTEGTIWQARGMLAGGGGRLPVAWDLEFWPLLRGEARVRLRPYAGTPGGPPRADLAVHAGALSARNLDLVVPASLLGALARMPPGWSVGGDVRMTATAIEWAPPGSVGEIDAVWQGARLTPPSVGLAVDLGSVRVTGRADDDAIGGAIRNEGGALHVTGDWSVHVREGARVSVLLTPRPGADPALSDALAMLGPKVDAGWRVEWRNPAR
jgi:hypothetical protein